jgi:mRNA-degrading endonuclease RelE of RelBE toxin-antitoxin system
MCTARRDGVRDGAMRNRLLRRYRVGVYRLMCDVQDAELVVLVLQVALHSESCR